MNNNNDAFSKLMMSIDDDFKSKININNNNNNNNHDNIVLDSSPDMNEYSQDNIKMFFDFCTATHMPGMVQQTGIPIQLEKTFFDKSVFMDDYNFDLACSDVLYSSQSYISHAYFDPLSINRAIYNGILKDQWHKIWLNNTNIYYKNIIKYYSDLINNPKVSHKKNNVNGTFPSLDIYDNNNLIIAEMVLSEHDFPYNYNPQTGRINVKSASSSFSYVSDHASETLDYDFHRFSRLSSSHIVTTQNNPIAAGKYGSVFEGKLKSNSENFMRQGNNHMSCVIKYQKLQIEEWENFNNILNLVYNIMNNIRTNIIVISNLIVQSYNNDNFNSQSLHATRSFISLVKKSIIDIVDFVNHNILLQEAFKKIQLPIFEKQYNTSPNDKVKNNSAHLFKGKTNNITSDDDKLERSEINNYKNINSLQHPWYETSHMSSLLFDQIQFLQFDFLKNYIFGYLLTDIEENNDFLYNVEEQDNTHSLNITDYNIPYFLKRLFINNVNEYYDSNKTTIHKKKLSSINVDNTINNIAMHHFMDIPYLNNNTNETNNYKMKTKLPNMIATKIMNKSPKITIDNQLLIDYNLKQGIKFGFNEICNLGFYNVKDKLQGKNRYSVEYYIQARRKSIYDFCKNVVYVCYMDTFNHHIIRWRTYLTYQWISYLRCWSILHYITLKLEPFLKNQLWSSIKTTHAYNDMIAAWNVGRLSSNNLSIYFPICFGMEIIKHPNVVTPFLSIILEPIKGSTIESCISFINFRKEWMESKLYDKIKRQILDNLNIVEETTQNTAHNKSCSHYYYNINDGKLPLTLSEVEKYYPPALHHYPNNKLANDSYLNNTFYYEKYRPYEIVDIDKDKDLNTAIQKTNNLLQYNNDNPFHYLNINNLDINDTDNKYKVKKESLLSLRQFNREYTNNNNYQHEKQAKIILDKAKNTKLSATNHIKFSKKSKNFIKVDDKVMQSILKMIDSWKTYQFYTLDDFGIYGIRSFINETFNVIIPNLSKVDDAVNMWAQSTLGVMTSISYIGLGQNDLHYNNGLYEATPYKNIIWIINYRQYDNSQWLTWKHKKIMIAIPTNGFIYKQIDTGAASCASRMISPSIAPLSWILPKNEVLQRIFDDNAELTDNDDNNNNIPLYNSSTYNSEYISDYILFDNTYLNDETRLKMINSPSPILNYQHVTIQNPNSDHHPVFISPNFMYAYQRLEDVLYKSSFQDTKIQLLLDEWYIKKRELLIYKDNDNVNNSKLYSINNASSSSSLSSLHQINKSNKRFSDKNNLKQPIPCYSGLKRGQYVNIFDASMKTVGMTTITNDFAALEFLLLESCHLDFNRRLLFLDKFHAKYGTNESVNTNNIIDQNYKHEVEKYQLFNTSQFKLLRKLTDDNSNRCMHLSDDMNIGEYDFIRLNEHRKICKSKWLPSQLLELIHENYAITLEEVNAYRVDAEALVMDISLDFSPNFISKYGV